MNDNKKLTWTEIEEQYDQEWIILDDFDWPDGTPNPKSGVVKCHSSDRKEFEQMVKEGGYINIARVFVGKRILPRNTVINCNLVTMSSCD